jgi:hypothetical protein
MDETKLSGEWKGWVKTSPRVCIYLFVSSLFFFKQIVTFKLTFRFLFLFNFFQEFTFF